MNREVDQFGNDVDELLEKLRRMSSSKIEQEKIMKQDKNKDLKQVQSTGIYKKIESYENGYNKIADLPMSKHDSRLFESLKQELARQIHKNEQLEQQLALIKHNQTTFVKLNQQIDHQKQQIDELSKTIAKQQHELHTLKFDKQKITANDQQLLVKDQKIIHASLDLNELQTKYLILLKNQETYDKEKQQLQDELQQTFDKLEKSQEVSTHLKQDLRYYKELDSKFTQLQLVQTNSELKQQKAKLQTEIERLNSLLLTKEQDIKLLQDYINELKNKHYNELDQLNEKHKHQLSKLKDKNANYTDLAINNLQEQLDNERKKAEDEIKNLKKEKTGVQADRDALIQHVQELQQLCQQKHKQNDNLIQENTDLKNRVNGLQQANKDLNERLNNALDQHHNEKQHLVNESKKAEHHNHNKVGFMVKENDKLKNQINQMTLDHQIDLDDLRESINNQKNKEMDQAINELTQQHNKVQNKLKDELQQEQQQHDKTMQKYGAHVKHLEDQIKVLKIANDQLQNQLNQKEQEYSDVKKHKGKLEKHLEDHKQKAGEYKKTHNEQHQKISYLLNLLDDQNQQDKHQLTQQNEELKKQLKKLEKDLQMWKIQATENNEDEINKLKEEIKKQKQENSKLKLKLMEMGTVQMVKEEQKLD